MRTSRLVLLLAAGLVAAGCGDDPQNAGPQQKLPILKEKVGQGATPPVPGAPSEAEKPSRWAKHKDPYDSRFVPPAAEPKADVKIAVGMTRDDLLTALGRCASRPFWLPQGPTRRMVEVFQPANPGCVAKFGQRHFQVVHGTLNQISEGLLEPEAPRTGPRPQNI